MKFYSQIQDVNDKWFFEKKGKRTGFNYIAGVDEQAGVLWQVLLFLRL
jgi:hypothetical protein